jgi:hypothetical protein
VVHVDALDAHDNRLATREQRVQVEGMPAPPPPPPPLAAVAPITIFGPSSSSSGSSSGSGLTFQGSFPGSGEAPDRDKGHGGFWSSPWTYLLGGVALAGAGVAVYFAARPTEDVSIASARVNAR